jgi:hypothetical protein
LDQIGRHGGREIDSGVKFVEVHGDKNLGEV